MDRYDTYFDIQTGGGGGVGRIYVGSRNQRGHGGIGSFLAGIFRRVLPLLSRGAKAVGKEAMRTGINIVSDVATRNTPIAESFRTHVKESGEVLKRKAEEKLDKLMEGSGYVNDRSFGVLQSLNSPETSLFKRKKRRYTSKKSKKRLGTLKKKRKSKKKGKKSGGKKKTKKSRKNRKRTLRDIFGRQ